MQSILESEVYLRDMGTALRLLNVGAFGENTAEEILKGLLVQHALCLHVCPPACCHSLLLWC